MFRQRAFINNKLGLFALMIKSLTVSLAVIFILFQNFGYKIKGIDNNQIIYILFFIVFLSVFIIISLSQVITSLYFLWQREKNEIDSLQIFSNLINNLNSEPEIYECLHKFLLNIQGICHVTIYYKNSNSRWTYISNKSPICCMPYKDCPLINRNKNFFANDISNDIVCNYLNNVYKSGSFLCTSLIQSRETGEIQSSVQIYTKKRFFFSEQSISKIRILIEFTITTILNKRAYNNLSLTASTDKLTKVYNRTFFEHYYEQQLMNSISSKRALSVLMFDLDNLKYLNDNFGHPAGDFSIKLFAQIIQKCVRKTDIVARYGGDEFIAILPSTDIQTATSIANRILLEIKTMPNPVLEGTELPPLSCSIGISTYPTLCQNPENLLKSSDEALYHAKRSGKNCLKVYQNSLK